LLCSLCYLHNTEDVRKQFGHDACIAIDNVAGFANAISLKLPFTHGFEGPVIYQDDTTIYKDIGPTTAEELMQRHRNPDGTLDMGMLQDMHRRQAASRSISSNTAVMLKNVNIGYCGQPAKP